MSLFEVPGWSIPTTLATSRVSRKRKRSGSDLHSTRVIKRPGPSVTKAGQLGKRKKGDGNVVVKRNTTTTKPAKKSEGRESSPKSRKSKPGKSTNDKPPPVSKEKSDNGTSTSTGLTALQKGMKQSLDGARFR
jgi:ribosomal RNA-processing protein 8